MHAQKQSKFKVSDFLLKQYNLPPLPPTQPTFSAMISLERAQQLNTNSLRV